MMASINKKGACPEADAELVEYCTKKLNAQRPLEVSIHNVSLLQDHVVGFSSQDMSQMSFRHDYGHYIPRVYGAWDTKEKRVVEFEDLPTFWKTFKPTVDQLVELMRSVKGYDNLLMTEHAVKHAHSSYGGMGENATVPLIKHGEFHCWEEGHTGMQGTNYYHYHFKLPKTSSDKLSSASRW